MATFDTLIDSFNDNSTGSQWSSFATGLATIAEQGGMMMAMPGNSTVTVGYAGYDSSTSYSLIGSYTFVNIAQSVTAASGCQQYMKLTADASNNIQWILENGILKPQKTVATVTGDITAGVTFNPITHAWWRIREVAGTTFFDLSNDGRIWVNHTSLLNPITLTTLTLELAAGTYLSISGPGVGGFDSFNVKPYTRLNSGLRPHPFSPGLAR